jgi:DNA polymerase I-like protein with 3'-5' exonuclease and polymerase domains
MDDSTLRDQIHKNRIRFGKLLLEFEGRVLGGIKLVIDKSSGHPSRYTYQFVKVSPENRPETPENIPQKDGCIQSVVSNPQSVHTDADNDYKYSCQSVSLEKGTDRGTDSSLNPCAPHGCNTTCQSVSQKPVHALRETKIQNEENIFNLDLHPVTASDPLETDNTDRLTPLALALDLETYAEIKVSKRGNSNVKSRTTPEALDPWKGEIRLVTVSAGLDNIQIFDLHEGPLPDETVAAVQRSTVTVHNALFDLLFLKVRFGILPANVFCTLTAARLLIPRRDVSRKYGATVERYLGVKLAKEHGGSDWGAFVLTDAQLAYARDDVRYLHRLEAILRAELEKAELEEVFALEMALIPVIIAMQYHGFAVDKAKLEQMRGAAIVEIERLARELREAFGVPGLNPESVPQLLEAFKAIGLELPNTDETTLTACENPLAGMVLEYRKQAKLEDSIRGLLKAIRPDGRIHARFNPLGARSGRFSSNGPNLQNITRGPLRSCFIASGPDRCLIVADYSQIELRIGAYFACDEVMLAAFRAGKDLHRETAAVVRSKAVEDVTGDDRQLAKAVNFGFEYGQRAKGFRTYARTKYGIDLSLEEAAELREKFFTRYTGLARWHREAWENARNGVCEARTILGRLLVAEIEADEWARFQLQTSYLVSGSAADVIKTAMVNTVAILPADVHLLASVHDELIFECPRAFAEDYKARIRLCMEESFRTLFPEVPIEVEAQIVNNWAEK